MLYVRTAGMQARQIRQIDHSPYLPLYLPPVKQIEKGEYINPYRSRYMTIQHSPSKRSFILVTLIEIECAGVSFRIICSIAILKVY